MLRVGIRVPLWNLYSWWQVWQVNHMITCMTSTTTTNKLISSNTHLEHSGLCMGRSSDSNTTRNQQGKPPDSIMPRLTNYNSITMMPSATQSRPASCPGIQLQPHKVKCSRNRQPSRWYLPGLATWKQCSRQWWEGLYMPPPILLDHSHVTPTLLISEVRHAAPPHHHLVDAMPPRWWNQWWLEQPGGHTGTSQNDSNFTNTLPCHHPARWPGNTRGHTNQVGWPHSKIAMENYIHSRLSSTSMLLGAVPASQRQQRGHNRLHQSGRVATPPTCHRQLHMR